MRVVSYPCFVTYFHIFDWFLQLPGQLYLHVAMLHPFLSVQVSFSLPLLPGSGALLRKHDANEFQQKAKLT